MKKYEVTEEKLKQAHSEACDKWKRIIEGIAPELFKPKFKVGDWVYETWPTSPYFNETPFRIIHIDGEIIHYDRYDDGNKGCSISRYSSLRLATPSEIEQHLIAIAEKKGFKEGVTCKLHVEAFKIKKPVFKYFPESDVLDVGGYPGNIYCEGKWATIIEEPKEQPKWTVPSDGHYSINGTTLVLKAGDIIKLNSK